MRGVGADDDYWSAMEERRLVLQQCAGCGKWNWPAVFRCGECGSWEHRWKPQTMQGSVYSWTRTWHDFGAPRELLIPFVSVLVELPSAGNVRLLGIMDTADAEGIVIGMAVDGEITKVSFHGCDVPVIRWRADASE